MHYERFCQINRRGWLITPEFFNKINRLFIIVICLVTCPALCEGAFETSDFSIMTLSLGGAGCGNAGNPGLMSCNPAGRFKTSGFTISNGNLYGMKELKHSRLSYYTSLNGNCLTINLSDFGNRVYREDVLELGISRKIISGLSAGIRVSNYYLSLQGLGADLTAGFDGGLLWSPGRSWSAGVAAMNLNDPKIGQGEDPIGRKLSVGVSYFPDYRITLFTDAVKEDRFSWEIIAGGEYYLSRRLTIRFGMNTPNPQLSGGFSLNLGRFLMLYAFRDHRYLGMSHMFGISIQTGEIKPE